jgi:predicted transcriptional regulator
MDNNFKAYNEAADILKALAHPVRLCIVKGLIDKGRCNVTFMQECLGLPQSTVSQHLQKLRSMGIVETDRNGLEIGYTVTNEKIKKLVQIFLMDISTPIAGRGNK